MLGSVSTTWMQWQGLCTAVDRRYHVDVLIEGQREALGNGPHLIDFMRVVLGDNPLITVPVVSRHRGVRER